jgi:transcriptional regulator with XRE-family HTH domain
MDNFPEWLNTQLTERRWKPADLARESHLSAAVISNILNGHRNAGEKTLIAIARGLHLPPKLVFEKAGILPQELELSPIKRQLIHLMEDMPDSDVELALALLEKRSDYYRQNPQVKPAK